MTSARETAATAALDVAAALADPAEVARRLPAAHVHSLGDGLAGTALLHARLSSVDPIGVPRALAHWESAAAALRDHGPAAPDGVFLGRGALAASLIVGAGHLPRGTVPAEAIREGTRWLSDRAEAIAAGGRPPFRPPVYDVVRGLSGIGRLLLAASEDGRAPVEAAPGLKAALTLLTGMVLGGTPGLPGWSTAARDSGDGRGSGSGGSRADTGMAHGIAGPLALLSLAESAGVSVPGQRDAIESAADWLLDHRAGASWPPWAPGAPPNGRRDAWCYGAPGIARALDLAAAAVGRDRYADAGRTSLQALADRDPGSWDTRGPGLCHGTAGVLQAALRIRCTVLADAAAAHTVRLLTGERTDGAGGGEAGFLTGACGAALALAQYADLPGGAARPPWDCPLLTA
ncbi:lanthionine synthetase LanC family protein [Streptomyces sp. NPDC059918]|uniref:lanthionine synthetase LanC family protein n=1 Tax=unclassified Streptomyces TaxID=2593676 RepID=UPI0036674AF7